MQPANSSSIGAESSVLWSFQAEQALFETSRVGASFVQWDVLFDTAFKATAQDGPPDLNPETPRPELQFLRLPFRF